MMENDWLNRLKDRMEDYEESAPDGLWDRIESSVTKKRKTRAVLPWIWRSAAAAAVAAIAVFAGVRLSSPSENSASPVAEGLSVQPDRDASLVAEGLAADEIAAAPAETLGDENIQAKEASEPSPGKQTVTLLPKEEGTFIADAAAVNIQEQEPQEAPEEAVEAEKTAEKRTSERYREPESYSIEDEWSKLMAADDNGRRQTRKPVVKLSLGGLNASSSGGSDMSARELASAQDSYVGEYDPSSLLSNHQNALTESESHHDSPVRAGALVSLPLTRRLSVESGLMYSFLKSSFTTTSAGNVTKDSQKLHYLGIPVNLTFDLISVPMLSIYLSGGAMAEKCVSGKVSTSTYLNDERIGEPVNSTLKDKNLLWSVNGAAGLQIKPSRRIGIYAEPGISYHFDNGSLVQTAYTDGPNFTLTFGLRLNL